MYITLYSCRVAVGVTGQRRKKRKKAKLIDSLGTFDVMILMLFKKTVQQRH